MPRKPFKKPVIEYDSLTTEEKRERDIETAFKAFNNLIRGMTDEESKDFLDEMEKERREALGEPEAELEEKKEPVKKKPKKEPVKKKPKKEPVVKKPKKEPVKKASEENHNVSLDHDSNIYLRDDIIYLNLERPES
jgi:outer membrane biosynthesis protein TonB